MAKVPFSGFKVVAHENCQKYFLLSETNEMAELAVFDHFQKLSKITIFEVSYSPIQNRFRAEFIKLLYYKICSDDKEVLQL